MEVVIGSFKCRLEICVLIILACWILFGHLLCSCCKVSLREGMEIMGFSMNQKQSLADKSQKISEGFSNFKQTSTGSDFAAADSNGYYTPPSTWGETSLVYTSGTAPPKGVQDILNRPRQPVPPDQLDMFATTSFKPECCPNTYSSSTGCACMTMGQYDFLKERGGNNSPYSVY